MTIDEAKQCVGQHVVWRHVAPGGYGFSSLIDVVIVSVSTSRVKIAAPLRRGGTKQTAVRPENLFTTAAA